MLSSLDRTNEGVHDPKTDTDKKKLFSMMDNGVVGLIFADLSLKLEHLNPVAFATLKVLEGFLPVGVKDLVGQPVSVFHRQPALIGKIIGDPRNLPYQTQIIIGPKTLDLQALGVYGENNNHYLGVMVEWTEITGESF